MITHKFHLWSNNKDVYKRQVHDHRLHAYGPGQLIYYPCARGAQPDILDFAVVKGEASHIDVTVLTELSTNHCPIQVHVATQHMIGRRTGQVVEWNCYKSAFCQRLSKAGPWWWWTVHHIYKAVAKYAEAVVSSVEFCSLLNRSLTSDYHWILKEVCFLEKSCLWRRSQWTQNQADKASLIWAAGRLFFDLQVFCWSYWEFTVTQMTHSTGAMLCVQAVSYTHLDVYKRQILPCGHKCPRNCHVLDSDHTTSELCTQRCRKWVYNSVCVCVCVLSLIHI